MLEILRAIRHEMKASPEQWVPTMQIGRPLRSDWSLERASRHAFKSNSWVFATADRLARALSSLPWIVKERVGGKWEVQGDADLIEYPNPKMTRKFLMWLLTLHLILKGESLLKKVLLRGEVDEVWPLHPDRTRPIASKEEWVKAYELTMGSRKDTIPADLVIRALIPDPDNPLRGMSPTQPIAAVIDTDTAALKWNLASVDNAAVPSFLLTTPQRLTPEQKTEYREEFDARYTGPEGARRPMVLSGGAKAERVSMTPQEMDWTESRKANAVEIATVMYHLAAMFSPEAQTYENLRTAHRYMWTDGVLPLADLFSDAFSLALVPRQERKERWITYDTSEVEALEEELGAKVERGERGVRSAIWTPNEVREQLGHEPKPGGDSLLADGRLVALDEIVGGGGGL